MGAGAGTGTATALPVRGGGGRSPPAQATLVNPAVSTSPSERPAAIRLDPIIAVVLIPHLPGSRPGGCLIRVRGAFRGPIP
ncbi:MAG: hypothetical protein K1X57_22635 [Gemmataceae bacterium]|nr:hypothetical protein [Gemmataceae bacterium]